MTTQSAPAQRSHNSRKQALLTREQETALFQRIRQGDVEARNELVAANMGFVRKVAYQFRGSSIPYEDLVNEGAMGLVRAAESFEASRGLKFISYAVWWVKAFITRAINEKGTLIRLPANQNYKIRRALRETKGKDQVNEEIQQLLNIGEGFVSLDSPLDDSKSTMANFFSDQRAVSPDASLEHERMLDFTNNLLAKVPEREARVIRGMFGIGQDFVMTAKELGDEMSISKERVRQLRDQGLQRIRRLNSDGYLNESVSSYLENEEQLEVVLD
jgi:RNA polymerase primary sigma factor